jgi:hypothetical protein
MLAICGTDAQILHDRFPAFMKFLDAGVLSLWVLSVQRASHHTSGAFNFEVTFTRASVHGWHISVRLHFESTLQTPINRDIQSDMNCTFTYVPWRGDSFVLCLLRRTHGLQIVGTCVRKDGRRVLPLYRTQL